MGNRELFRVISAYTNHAPPLRKLLDRVDLETIALGPSRGFQVIFEERKTRLQESWDGDRKKTREVLEKKPVIVVCNHPYALEPLMLLSTFPYRDNVTIVGAKGVEKIFGSEIGSHMVPIFQPPYFDLETKWHKKRRQEKNMATIDQALDKLRGGDLVLIAPDGGAGTDEWKKGSVRLMEAALKMPEAYVVMGYVPDSKSDDTWKIGRKKELQKEVRISEAINVKDLPITGNIKHMPEGDRYKLFMLSHVMTRYYKEWTAI